MSQSSQPVIAKVGAILLRQNAAQQTEIFVLRPKPKNEGEQAKWVLPRGSRQYLSENGEWVDARDQETAEKFLHRLEPVAKTLYREMHEEAGLAVSHDTDGSVMQQLLGVREFRSATKESYPVHWNILQPNAQAQADMKKPEDAVEYGWKTRDEIQTLADAGDFSLGYLPVIDEALALAKQTDSTRAQNRPGSALRGR